MATISAARYLYELSVQMASPASKARWSCDAAMRTRCDRVPNRPQKLSGTWPIEVADVRPQEQRERAPRQNGRERLEPRLVRRLMRHDCHVAVNPERPRGEIQ